MNLDHPIYFRKDGTFRSHKQVRKYRLYVAFFGALALLTGFSLTAAYTAQIEAQVQREHASHVQFKYPEDVREVYKTETGRITYYKWTGYHMANGKFPKDGYVATSDRTIKLGTKVLIEGKEYIVGDRTNARIQNEFKYPTFDIYSEYTNNTLLQMGTHSAKIMYVK